MPNILVIYPTGHRSRIEILPNQPLFKVLYSACSQKSLDPEGYMFKHNGRSVDLATTFRLSGLVNNATLDLVAIDETKSASFATTDIRLCFRLNDGYRVVWTGQYDRPLWSILEAISVDHSRISELINSVTEQSQSTVAVVYLQEQIIGVSSLKSTTPGDLGVRSGSALLQLLSVDKPQTTDDQELPVFHSHVLPNASLVGEPILRTVINEDICTDSTCPEELVSGFVSPFSIFAERPSQSVFGQPEKPPPEFQIQQEPQTLGSLLGISLEPSTCVDPETFPNATDSVEFPFANFQFPTETAGLDLEKQESRIEYTETESSVDRQLVVFRRAIVADRIDATADDLPDDFFELTQSDLRKLLDDCHRVWASSEPLQTTAMRKATREKMYGRYPRAVIQFIWSDGIILQACFNPFEKVYFLYEFIKAQLLNPHLNFQLYTTPPKVVLKDRDINLIEANLVPMSKVCFSAEDTKACSVLKPEIIDSALLENAIQAGSIAKSWMESAAQKLNEKRSMRVAPSNDAIPTAKPNGSKVVPKWMKLSKS